MSSWRRSNPIARRRLEAALDSLFAVSADRERLEAEARDAEALRRSDAIKTAVLQTVSHDFRTPLATMEAAIGGLQSTTLDLSATDRADLLDTIGLEVARLRRLVENLLDLSRLQAGAAVTHAELWPVEELLARAAADVAPAGRVHIDVPDGLPAAKVDAAQVQRALANLIENALKFSDADAAVELTAAEQGGRLVLEVLDRGRGIDAGEAATLLEPFVRGGAGGSTGGSGLGLAIARGFVAVNGGTLSLEPRPGRRHVRARHASRRTRARGGLPVSARVLVVDDEPQFLRALVTNLRGAGYEVETAVTAAEALTAAGLHPPDAFILDLLLPDGTGVEVCRELRTWTDAPIVLVSAVGEEEEKIAALDAGADDYVTKPFAIGELLARLRAALRRAGTPGEPVLSVGPITVDLEKHAVTVNGKAVHLTPHEFRLLRVLAQNRGQADDPSRDPARGVGPCLRRRVELPPRLRLAAPSQARARSGPAALPADGARRGLPARRARA